MMKHPPVRCCSAGGLLPRWPHDLELGTAGVVSSAPLGGPMRQVAITHEPIVPAIDGQPPGFVVACLDCEFACDAHGLDAEDAVQSVVPTHASGQHRMIARPVSYAEHPLYERPGG